MDPNLTEQLITPDLIKQLEDHMTDLKKDVRILVKSGEHSKREELIKFLKSISETSGRLSLDEDKSDSLRSAVSFSLEADGSDTGIAFSGIPSGHEFTSLILAILQAGGGDLKLDETTSEAIEKIEEALNFEIFVSLDCHNCPDVVQSLNKLSLLNPNISTEMIDGGLFQDLVKQRDVQGVPVVFLNGELFSSGRVNMAKILANLAPYTERVSGDAGSLPSQDIAVVGGGPAGISASIYAARKGFSVVMVAEELGGQVAETVGIENLISVKYTTGKNLTVALREHLNDYQVTIRENLTVDRIEPGKVNKIYLSNGESIEARSVIIATGAKWRELGVPGEKENKGSGVAYCPHCDGPFYKDKKVVVVGGGNSGIEAAIDLSKIAKDVRVLEFLTDLKADQVLVDRATSTENIKIVTNVATDRIEAKEGKVSAILYTNRDSSEQVTHETDGVFVQIGLEPNSGFLGGDIARNQRGEIIVDSNCRTSNPSVFACGDVTTVTYKQIIVAMGQGATAALSASEHLMMSEESNEARQAAT